MKSHKTDYPGVFYREAERIGRKGLEGVCYIVFRQDGKVFEEKAGRQFKDNMTPARAARIGGNALKAAGNPVKRFGKTPPVVPPDGCR